ncbi:MAG TPA: TolC family protein, partial [Myxococcales bacterium]|nr:TolC family protein [Myxococcales bacterium]
SAHGALVQASALPNPGLSVSSVAATVSPLGAPVPGTVGVSWTVPIGGKRSAGIASAEAGLSAAKATNAAVRQQISLAVATGFVNVLLARALLEFALQDQANFRQSLDLNELRYKDGKIAFGDVLKLRIQALAEDDTVRQARQNLISGRADLLQLLGEGAVKPDYEVQGALEPAPQAAETTPESLLAAALARRPDYLALADQTEAARHGLTQARRQPIPDLGVSVEYSHASGVPDTYDIGLSVSVPLFDRNTGNIEQAAAALEKARIAQEALRIQLRDAATKAVTEWRSSSEQLGAYRSGVESARESLEISRHAYELGQGSLLDFLSAQTSYRQVEGAYRSAQARTALAAWTLRFVAGEEIK